MCVPTVLAWLARFQCLVWAEKEVGLQISNSRPSGSMLSDDGALPALKPSDPVPTTRRVETLMRMRCRWFGVHVWVVALGRRHPLQNRIIERRVFAHPPLETVGMTLHHPTVDQGCDPVTAL